LVERVKDGDADAWRRLLSLYGPLVFWWCHRKGLRQPDAEEISQEVFLTVSSKVTSFTKHWEHGSFRAWLRRITANKLGDYFRRRRAEPPARGTSSAQEFLAQVPADSSDSSADGDDESERGILYRRALEVIRSEFEPRSWEAVWQTAVEGRRAADVAAALGMTPNAVYIAKSRILARLHEELAGLID
jgi:RNA polymerase sigma-70 factor (ECF subfamily)